MGIATVFTTVIGALSSPTAIATSTLLTGANTVMGGIGLKNDADIKAGITNANSKLEKVQDSLDEIQGICASTCTVDDIESMFTSAPTAPTSTPAAPTPTTSTPAPTQTQDNNVPPAWAQQLMQQQVQQAEVIKTLMQQQNTAATTPTNTTVNVNPTTTPAPTAPAATTTPASTPAPQPTTSDTSSALETKLDKLLEGFGALVDSLKQANTASTPATTGSA